MWYTARYSIVLWAYPPHDPSTIVPYMLRLLEETSGQRTVWHFAGEPDREVPACENEWIALVEEERDAEFGALDLFFDSASGLSLSLSVDAPVVVRDFNVMTVLFEAGCLSDRAAMFDFDRLRTLFINSVHLFRPFWSRVGDREAGRAEDGQLHLSVDVTKAPASVHWFNYFGTDMVERLGGMEKLLGAPDCEVEVMDDPAGLLVILQRDTFDYHNSEHRQRLHRANQYLDLKRLHALYPKRR